ncbi:MAG: ParB/Srx family N-terminal domain-containing protein [Pseudomonadota bacterium]
MPFDFEVTRPPPVQRIETVNDLYDIRFSEGGLAAVEVPFALLDALPLVNEARTAGPRLQALLDVVRDRGFIPRDPIICRIGMKGRWVVVDGGHRITAARMVGSEFWPNLFRPRVRSLYFLLFTTPESWSKLRARAAENGRDPAGDDRWADPIV